MYNCLELNGNRNRVINRRCEWTLRKNWSWLILFLESKYKVILLEKNRQTRHNVTKLRYFLTSRHFCRNCRSRATLQSCAHVSLTHVVFVLTAPPVLGEVSPSFLIQKEGDTIDMFCEASATPEPSLTWYKDGKVSNASSLNFRVNVETKFLSVFGALKKFWLFSYRDRKLSSA